jgi:hypothetical protein
MKTYNFQKLSCWGHFGAAFFQLVETSDSTNEQFLLLVDRISFQDSIFFKKSVSFEFFSTKGKS